MAKRLINIDQVPDAVFAQITAVNTKADNAVAIANTANLQGVRLGGWNASTNTPTLTTDASGVTAGGIYEVIVAGTQSITGTSVVFVIGDRIARVGTSWFLLPFSLVNYYNKTDIDSTIKAPLQRVIYQTSSIDITDDGEVLFLDANNNIAGKIDNSGNFVLGNVITNNLSLNSISSPKYNVGINSIEQTEEGEFLFLDSNNNIAGKIDAAGKFILPQLQTSSLQLTGSLNVANADILESDNYEFIMTDSQDNILMKIDKGDTFLKVNLESLSPKILAYSPTFGQIYDIEYHFIKGQSNSVGYSTTPLISTTTKYNSLMFTGGVQFFNSATDSTKFADFVPIVERDSSATANLHETPASGLTNMYLQMLSQKDAINYTDANYDYAMLMSTPDYGGASIAGIAKGTAAYNRFLDSVTAGKSLAATKGKTFGIRCIYFIHGNSDINSTADYYIYMMKKLRLDLNADIKAIIGSSQVDIPIIMYQFTRHNFNAEGTSLPTIGLAQLELVKNEPGFFISNPCFIVNYNPADLIHFSTLGALKQGAYLGLVGYKHFIKGQTPKPFIAQKHKGFGTIVEVVFQGVEGKISFDTTIVSAQTNYGFGIVNGGSGAISISSVTIVRKDTIRFVFSRVPITGDILTYAINGTTGQADANQAKGNLRDNSGDNYSYDNSGQSIPLHNWALMHQYKF